MRQWIKANGGPPAVVVVGLGAISVNVVLGAVLMGIGAVWFISTLGPVQRAVPFAVVRKPSVTLRVTDANIESFPTGQAVVQIVASVVNLGAATVLHDWALDLDIGDETLPGSHIIGPGTDRLGRPESLADDTGRNPLSGVAGGSLWFGFKNFPVGLVPEAKAQGVFVLTVKDRFGRGFTTTKRLSVLAEEGERTTTAL